jgi:hypothetical protein
MERRIVLVDFYWTRDKDPRVPLGHASIRTVLRERGGHDVRSIVVAVNEPHLDAVRISTPILKEMAGIPSSAIGIAFGAYVWGEVPLQDALRRLRSLGLDKFRSHATLRSLAIDDVYNKTRKRIC